MKVAQILYSGLSGCGSVFFSMVAASFDGQDGVEHLPVFFGVEPLPKEYLELCHAYNVQPLTVIKRGGLDWLSQWRLLKYLLEQKPDVVIAHSHSCFPPILAYKLVRPGTRILFIEHHPNSAKTTPHWIASAIAPWLFRSVIYLSEDSKVGVQATVGSFFRESRASVIPNGVDTVLFRPSEERRGDGLIRIGMQARMTEIKDHETLIRAMKYQESSCILVLAGDGDTRKYLEALVCELGLEGRVEFLGLLGQEELAGFLQSLDVYAHATHGETMSIALMQAQSCGLPVVASRVSGVEDQLEDGLDALLVEPRNPSALADAIRRVLTEQDLRAGLQARARIRAERDYSQNRMWESYVSLLE